MNWELFERPLMMTRKLISALEAKPTQVTPGRWRAMQLQIRQEQQHQVVNLIKQHHFEIAPIDAPNCTFND